MFGVKFRLTLGLLLCSSLASVVLAEPAKVTGTSREGSDGSLYIKSLDGGWSRIDGSAEVATGARLMTDSGNAAVMEFPGGVKAVLGPQASLNYLGSEGGVCSLRLTRGTTRFVVPANAKMKLEAGSLNCTASNAEGEATLELLGNPTFTSIRGELNVTGSGGELYKVGPNTRLSVATDGKTVEVRPADAGSTTAQSAPPVSSQPPLSVPQPQSQPQNQPQNQPQVGGNSDIWSNFPGVLERILPTILNRNGGGVNIPNLPVNLPINIPGFPR